MKNYKILTLPSAERDIEEITEYIGEKLKASGAAAKFIDKILDVYEKLSTFPEMGTELKNRYPLQYKYRWILIDNYILFYIIKDDKVIVMRLLYSSSNYLNVLM